MEKTDGQRKAKQNLNNQQKEINKVRRMKNLNNEADLSETGIGNL